MVLDLVVTIVAAPDVAVGFVSVINFVAFWLREGNRTGLADCDRPTGRLTELWPGAGLPVAFSFSDSGEGAETGAFAAAAGTAGCTSACTSDCCC